MFSQDEEIIMRLMRIYLMILTAQKSYKIIFFRETLTILYMIDDIKILPFININLHCSKVLLNVIILEHYQMLLC